MRIFAKSLRSHRALKSMPAMFVITPKEMTTRQSTRIVLIKAGLVEIEADADEHRHEVIDRSVPGERSAGC